MPSLINPIKNFTFKKRHNFNSVDLKNLGPGKYDIRGQFGKETNYFQSNFRQPGRAKICPEKTVQRKTDQQAEVRFPPIQYDFTYQLNN